VPEACRVDIVFSMAWYRAMQCARCTLLFIDGRAPGGTLYRYCWLSECLQTSNKGQKAHPGRAQRWATGGAPVECRPRQSAPFHSCLDKTPTLLLALDGWLFLDDDGTLVHWRSVEACCATCRLSRQRHRMPRRRHRCETFVLNISLRDSCAST
jgi:hypothetical protein